MFFTRWFPSFKNKKLIVEKLISDFAVVGQEKAYFPSKPGPFDLRIVALNIRVNFNNLYTELCLLRDFSVMDLILSFDAENSLKAG